MSGSNSIDFNALKAEAAIAQQSDRKMCTIPTNELISLLMRAECLAKYQSAIPFKIGFCCPEDVHRMMQGELHQVGLRRKKGSRYRVEVLVQSLPDGSKLKVIDDGESV